MISEKKKTTFKKKNMMVKTQYSGLSDTLCSAFVKVRYDTCTGGWKYCDVAKIENKGGRFYIYNREQYSELCYKSIGVARSLNEALIAVALLHNLGIEDVPQVE